MVYQNGNILKTLQQAGREVWVPVQGCSQRPLLREGDEVRVGFCPPEEIREGDLAVFISDGQLTAHRVLKVFRMATGGTLFLEKGDGNPWGRFIPPEQVKGVVRTVRSEGKVIDLGVPAWLRRNRRAARIGYGYIRFYALFSPSVRVSYEKRETFGPVWGYRFLLGLYWAVLSAGRR